MARLRWRWILAGTALGLHAVFPALLFFDPPAFVLMVARPRPWLLSAVSWTAYAWALGWALEAFQRWTSRRGKR